MDKKKIRYHVHLIIFDHEKLLKVSTFFFLPKLGFRAKDPETIDVRELETCMSDPVAQSERAWIANLYMGGSIPSSGDEFSLSMNLIFFF